LFGSRRRKLSSTIAAIAFVRGSRNVDEKGGIEEADTNGNSVNEHAPLLRPEISCCATHGKSTGRATTYVVLYNSGS
jgi:hypothetical protein